MANRRSGLAGIQTGVAFRGFGQHWRSGFVCQVRDNGHNVGLS